jgi:N-acetylneuraminate synthase
MKKTYIIAEIGINHNGSLENAQKLIDIAAAAGCDAVKFQKRTPELAVPEHQKNILRDTPWGTMKYIDYKHKVEFEKEEYDFIDSYCSSRGIDWSASVWDIEAVRFLKDYKIPFVKIPSAKITDHNLLIEAVNNFDSIIISTGMSTEEEIKSAVEVIEKTKQSIDREVSLSILHCNSSYPAPIDQLNLSAIISLKDRYPNYTIGYSGHELTLGTTVSSVLLGAEILERHITLDRNMWGSDHSCSVTPWGLFKLVNGVRELEQAYGDGKLKLEDSEIEAKKKLRG